MNAISGIVTFGCGDFLAQYQSRTDAEYKLRNTLVIASLGGVSTTIVLPYWFRTLDRVFGKSMSNSRVVLYKMLADQVVYAPFAVSVFIFCQSEMCGVRRAQEMKRSDLVGLWLSDCAVWPLFNWINFRHVPLRHRPPFVACCQFAWQTFVSSICHGTIAFPKYWQKIINWITVFIVELVGAIMMHTCTCGM
jgi:protein Mpv17